METRENQIVPISVDPNGLLSQLLETAPDAILTFDRAGYIKLASSLAIKLLGYKKEELLSRNIQALLRGQALDLILQSQLDGKIVSAEMEKKSGEKVSVDISLAPLHTPDGDFISAFIRDVSGKKKLERELRKSLSELENTNSKLRRLSEIDFLTEALNRRGFDAILKRECERAQHEGTVLSLAMMDLDNLKLLNEQLGYSAGDTVLREISKRATRTLRSTDYLSRVGGDEFMMLFPSTDVQEAAMVAERVRNEINATEIIPGLVSTVSCGVVQLPPSLKTLEEALPLLRNALQRSKSDGKNRVTIGSACSTRTAIKTFTSDEMDQILANQLSAVSDPIYSLEDKILKGVEFHVRGPEGVLHTPTELLRVAAEMNRLSQIDLVCAQTCTRAAESLIGHHLPFHLNLLPSTLESVPVSRLIELFDKVKDSRIICVELSVLRINTEPGYLIEPIKELKEHGIQIALDDVCYGRSSLEALIVLEPTFIKLDNHFISGLGRDVRKLNAVKRLIKMSRVVNTEIIAEGIEFKDDFEALKMLGINLGQGLLFRGQ